jgi:hypothetical protein
MYTVLHIRLVHSVFLNNYKYSSNSLNLRPPRCFILKIKFKATFHLIYCLIKFVCIENVNENKNLYTIFPRYIVTIIIVHCNYYCKIDTTNIFNPIII